MKQAQNTRIAISSKEYNILQKLVIPKTTKCTFSFIINQITVFLGGHSSIKDEQLASQAAKEL